MPTPIGSLAPNRLDLTGQRFGRLIVLEVAETRKGVLWWRCRCDCGVEVEVRSQQLRIGQAKSCGCLRREVGRARTASGGEMDARKHGAYQTPEYAAWHGARGRCLSPTNKDFPNYGGRGITIDPRWSTFEAFLADMGPRPSPRHTLDRRDNDGPYSKDNCRWATRKEQQRNRSTAVRLTLNGETLCVAEWSERLGLPHSTILHRLARGWPVERTLTTPSLRG
jgi:hypothetical protein